MFVNIFNTTEKYDVISLPTHIQIRYDPNADILFVTAESPTTVITTNKKGGLNYEKISQ